MSPERDQHPVTLEEIISNAKEIMLRHGNHVPTLIMESDKNLIVSQIPGMPATHGERLEFMHFVGQVAAKSGRINQLQQVFLVHEGWMSVPSEDNLAQTIPSQDPERKEVLIISAIQLKELKKKFKVFEILRDHQDQVTGLEEFLPGEQKEDDSVRIPLLESFVDGYQTAFWTKFN